MIKIRCDAALKENIINGIDVGKNCKEIESFDTSEISPFYIYEEDSVHKEWKFLYCFGREFHLGNRYIIFKEDADKKEFIEKVCSVYTVFLFDKHGFLNIYPQLFVFKDHQ